MSGAGATVLRFGRFDFDIATGELSRGGSRVHLQRQPARLLALLLERPGQLVTRDEIRRHLWTDDVFVDFQRGLNFCVMQIRTALEDDANTPRFVETLPRRGYRFVAAVERAPRPATTPVPRDPRVARPSRRRAALVSLLAASLVFASGAGGARTTARAGAVRDPVPATEPVRVAVLPFQNFGAADDQVLGDGLTEEVIAEIGRIRPTRLSVIARTSVQRYQNAPPDLSRVGEELDVDYVVEGSVRHADQRVRVTARLVRVAGESQLWAESYERTASDFLSLQREIARATAAGVGVAIDPVGPSPAPVAGADPEALRQYLLGRRARDLRTVEGLEEARRRFDEAIRLSPDYAPPHAALADTWLSLAQRGGVSPTEALARAGSAADTALRLDPASDEAYAALGLVAGLGRWDLPAARRHFERALSLNPGNTTARLKYALLLSYLDHVPEAIQQAREAARADPLSATALYYLGMFCLFADQPAEALRLARQIAEVDPQSVLGPLLEGGAFSGLGRNDEAIAAFERTRRIEPKAPIPLVNLACAFARAGRKGEARAAYASLRALQRERPFINVWFARVAVELGEREEAVRFYERAVAAHEFDLLRVRGSDSFASLRSDPHFVAAERRLIAQVKTEPN